MRTLLNRMRRTGVLRDAPQFRAALVWSHPDAGLQLLGSHPGLRLARPNDIAPEFGIEVFDAQSQESGAYTIEVRRPCEDHRTVIEAQLVLIWRQGEDDEQVQIIPLRFEGDRYAFAWTVTGDTVAEATPTPKPEEDE
jgi:hypothetical protein